jgi:hypothetical protein
MNFFGVEISDAQFEAAMAAARREGGFDQKQYEAAIREALGFETGGAPTPPAGDLNAI